MTTTYSHTTYVDRGTVDDPEEDIKVEVEYTFTPGSKQTWDDPGDPAEIEFVRAYRSDTCADITLTDKEQQRIYDEITCDPPYMGRDPDEWYDAMRSGDL